MIEQKQYAFYGAEAADVMPLRAEDRWLGTPKEFYDLLTNIWCEYTCAPRMRSRWTSDNVTVGQCSITAFLVQDYYGGEVYGTVLPDGNLHCFNVIKGRNCDASIADEQGDKNSEVQTFDLTSEQLKGMQVDYDDAAVQSREKHFAKEEKYRRYLYLKAEVEKKRKHLRVLFIGNSHTYVNDLPEIFVKLAEEDGVVCDVTMIAHGGWFLAQHVEQPDVRFNIRYGHYDYVVLQEHAHPFGPEEKMFAAVRQLCEWCAEAGSRPVVYMTWAQKSEPEAQEPMSDAHRRIAEETGALLAPVGDRWWEQLKKEPETELYYEDGQHASLAGSVLAASVIWTRVKEDFFLA